MGEALDRPLRLDEVGSRDPRGGGPLRGSARLDRAPPRLASTHPWRAVTPPTRGGGGRAGGCLGWSVPRHGWFESLDAMPYATYGGPIVREGHPAAPRAR